VAKGFETPFISGKDSLYNESPIGPVTPTLLITAVGIIPDVRKAVSIDLKRPGNAIYFVGQTLSELGGSEYYRLKGFVGNTVPQVDVKQAKKIMDSIIKVIESGYVRACHDLSEGGLAVTAAEMASASDYGVDMWLKDVPRPRGLTRSDFILFSESNSRFLVEVDEKHREDFEDLMKNNPFALIGSVRKEPFFTVHDVKQEELVEVDLATLRKAWKSTFGGWSYEA
jgi:phosphoribosylformylglycinamidine synthase